MGIKSKRGLKIPNQITKSTSLKKIWKFYTVIKHKKYGSQIRLLVGKQQRQKTKKNPSKTLQKPIEGFNALL